MRFIIECGNIRGTADGENLTDALLRLCKMRRAPALGVLLVLSYADTAAGHVGYIYRALNFHYAGWTDMERKTPRFDYITPGMHTRDAFRKGERRFTEKVRRKPKVKYWITTGNRRERKALEARCLWPKMDWKTTPPPSEHQRLAEAAE